MAQPSENHGLSLKKTQSSSPSPPALPSPTIITTPPPSDPPLRPRRPSIQFATTPKPTPSKSSPLKPTFSKPAPANTCRFLPLTEASTRRIPSSALAQTQAKSQTWPDSPASSIFTPSDSTSTLAKPRPGSSSKRSISPPAPTGFEPRVAFDTFDNKDAPELSFTLRADHVSFAFAKHARVFLCGLDENVYSSYALEWLLSELVDDGDTVVCFRVLDKKSKLAGERSVEKGKYRDEAELLMARIQDVARMGGIDGEGGGVDKGRSISLVLEFGVGDVPKFIQRLIAVYEPASLVVGTRGKSLDGFQGLLPGSVSKYCLQNSPVPVIVVRPEAKREKKKRKRKADPNRRGYVNMGRGNGGMPLLTRVETHRRAGGRDPEAKEKEALAVAKAIGLSTMEATLKASMVADTGRAIPLGRAHASEDELEEDEDESDEEAQLSLDAILSQGLKKDPKPKTQVDVAEKDELKEDRDSGVDVGDQKDEEKTWEEEIGERYERYGW